jgi:hypothetical protein
MTEHVEYTLSALSGMDVRLLRRILTDQYRVSAKSLVDKSKMELIDQVFECQLQRAQRVAGQSHRPRHSQLSMFDDRPRIDNEDAYLASDLQTGDICHIEYHEMGQKQPQTCSDAVFEGELHNNQHGHLDGLMFRVTVWQGRPGGRWKGTTSKHLYWSEIIRGWRVSGPTRGRRRP